MAFRYRYPRSEPPASPIAVFFPTQGQKICPDNASSGGFDTFGFLAMILAGFNAVNLVASNDNNRRNNNNNNNNDNNDNNNIVNRGQITGEVDNQGNMIILPPVTGRKKRDLEAEAANLAQVSLTALQMQLAPNWDCRRRALCERHAKQSDDLVLAETLLIVQSYLKPHGSNETGALRNDLLKAARTGRVYGRCAHIFRWCQDLAWGYLTQKALNMWKV